MHKASAPRTGITGARGLFDTYPRQTQDQFLRRSTKIDDVFESTDYSGQWRVWSGANGMVMPHVIGHQKDLVCHLVELRRAVSFEVVGAARWRRVGDADCEVLAQPPKAMSCGLDQSGVRVVEGKCRRVGDLPIDFLKILQASMSAYLTLSRNKDACWVVSRLTNEMPSYPAAATACARLSAMRCTAVSLPIKCW